MLTHSHPGAGLIDGTSIMIQAAQAMKVFIELLLVMSIEVPQS